MATNKKASGLTLLDTISDTAIAYLVQGGDKGALFSTIKASVLDTAALTGPTSIEAIAPEIHDLGTVSSGEVTLDADIAANKVTLSGTTMTVAFPSGDPRVSQALSITSTSETDSTITIPQSWSANRGALITSFTLAAGGRVTVSWWHNGSSYEVLGDPLTRSQRLALLALVQSDIASLVSDLAAKAPLANPTFTGTVTVPNQSASDNSTKAANTAYVDTAISAIGAGDGDVVGPVSSTDNAIARFDSTTGKLLQNSGARINDSGDVELYGDGIPGSITLTDASDTGKRVTHTAPETVATSYTIIWPDAPGTAGQVLSVSSVVGTALVMEWVTPA